MMSEIISFFLCNVVNKMQCVPKPIKQDFYFVPWHIVRGKYPPLTLTSVRNINENKLMDLQHIQLVMHSYCTFLIALFTFNTVVHTLLHAYARLLTTSFIMFRLLHSKTLWVNDLFIFFCTVSP